jgi:hypothetical protein
MLREILCERQIIMTAPRALIEEVLTARDELDAAIAECALEEAPTP